MVAIRLDWPRHVGCLKALGALDDVKLDGLTLVQGLEAIGLDGGIVHEHILTVRSLDKAEALRIIEPLHCPFAFQLTTPPSVPTIRCPTTGPALSGNTKTAGAASAPAVLPCTLRKQPTELRLPNRRENSLPPQGCQGVFCSLSASGVRAHRTAGSCEHRRRREDIAISNAYCYCPRHAT